MSVLSVVRVCWLVVFVGMSCTVCSAASAKVIVQVSVSGRGIPVKDLAVWVLPEAGEGWRLDGPLVLFSLPLPVDERYIVHFEARNCIPEEVVVDARMPTNAAGVSSYFPVNVLLERGTTTSFQYLRPTSWIAYDPGAGTLGHVDANTQEVPAHMQQRMALLVQRPGVALQAVAMELPRPAAAKRTRGRIWLNELMEPCGRDDAAYQLERGGTEHGAYVGYVRTMQGDLRAIGHYADADLLVPHGDFTFYHRGGAVESAGRYANGMKTGLWRRFTTDGRALAERVYDPRPLAELLLASREVAAFGGEQHLRNRSDAATDQATLVHRVAHAPVANSERVAEEAPPMAEAPARSAPPDGLFVERLRVSVVDKVMEEGRAVEYRRVTTYYGAVHYFRGGRPCSEAVYRRAVPQ